MVEVVRPYGVRVEIDASEVDHPRKLRGVADHDLLGGPTRWKAQLHGLDPLGAGGRGALLEEELALCSVGIALQGHGTPRNAPQGTVGDQEVVTDQIELGVSGTREEDLVRVGDRHLPAGRLQDVFALRHAETIDGGAVRPAISGGPRSGEPSAGRTCISRRACPVSTERTWRR